MQKEQRNRKEKAAPVGGGDKDLDQEDGEPACTGKTHSVASSKPMMI